MTTKIKELTENLVGDMTTHQDILEFLDVVDMKSENVVAISLIPHIKDRIKMLSENVSAYIDTLTNYDKDNKDIDISKFTYDVMYPDGRIEIGLQAPSREKLISLLDSCTSSEGAQILRVIDSNGKIIESNKPHYVSETFSVVRGGSIESLTSDEIKLVDQWTKKELPKIVHKMNNPHKDSFNIHKKIEMQQMMESEKIEEKLSTLKSLNDTCFGDISSIDETKEIVENFVSKSLPKIVDDLNNLCEKKPTPKKKPSKKNKTTKKA